MTPSKSLNPDQLNLLAAVIREGDLTNLSRIRVLYQEQTGNDAYIDADFQALTDSRCLIEYIGVRNERETVPKNEEEEEGNPKGKMKYISSTTDPIFGITETGKRTFREGRQALKESALATFPSAGVEFLLSDDAARLEQQAAGYVSLARLPNKTLPERSFLLNAKKLPGKGTFSIDPAYFCPVERQNPKSTGRPFLVR